MPIVEWLALKGRAEEGPDITKSQGTSEIRGEMRNNRGLSAVLSFKFKEDVGVVWQRASSASHEIQQHGYHYGLSLAPSLSLSLSLCLFPTHDFTLSLSYQLTGLP